MTDLPTLWHFRISHFNEKARWALDWKRVPHRRRAVLPGSHLPRIWWETGQKHVPVLQIGGETIVDSTAIIAALEARYPEPPLYPSEEGDRIRALGLEDFFDEELGPDIRRVFFFHLLADADAASDALTIGEAPLTRRLYRIALPGIRAVMRLDMQIDAARAAVSRHKVEVALTRLEREIQPSGYLVGTRFSVADLTAAALFSPLLSAPEFPYAAPPMLPPLAEWRASLAERPGFQWACEMYRRHRGASSEVTA
jgi:glutathione S-transferase